MGRISLLIQVFEYLKEGDSEEAAHALRHLADDVELQGSPNVDDLQEALHVILEIVSDMEDFDDNEFEEEVDDFIFD